MSKPLRVTHDVSQPRRIVAVTLALILLAFTPALAAEPAGQMTWALHFNPAPTLYEPAETAGQAESSSAAAGRALVA
jgi:hypothetical protein